VDRFARPFYGGIFLDDSLRTSARAFRFDFKMQSEGDIAVPAGGMGQIPEQIAEELRAHDAVRLNAPVDALLRDGDGRVVGVRLRDGDEEVRGDAVVVATPAPEAARLTGHPMPPGRTGTINLYFAGTAPVYANKRSCSTPTQGRSSTTSSR
jgi:phytoene dehydrogenase-like protein